MDTAFKVRIFPEVCEAAFRKNAVTEVGLWCLLRSYSNTVYKSQVLTLKDVYKFLIKEQGYQRRTVHNILYNAKDLGLFRIENSTRIGQERTKLLFITGLKGVCDILGATGLAKSPIDIAVEHMPKLWNFEPLFYAVSVAQNVNLMYTSPRKKKDLSGKLNRKEWAQQKYQREAIEQGFLRIKHWAIPNIIDGYAYMTGNGFSGTNTKLEFVRRNYDVKKLDKSLQRKNRIARKSNENRFTSKCGNSKVFFADIDEYTDYSKKHDGIQSSAMMPSKYSYRNKTGAIGLYEPVNQDESVKKLYKMMQDGLLPGHTGRIHLSKFLKGRRCRNYYFDNCDVPYKNLGIEFDTGITDDKHIIAVPVQTHDQHEYLQLKRQLLLAMAQKSLRAIQFRKRVETKIRAAREKFPASARLLKSCDEYDTFIGERVSKYILKVWKINKGCEYNRNFGRNLPTIHSIPKLAFYNLKPTLTLELIHEDVLACELEKRRQSYARYIEYLEEKEQMKEFYEEITKETIEGLKEEIRQELKEELRKEILEELRKEQLEKFMMESKAVLPSIPDSLNNQYYAKLPISKKQDINTKMNDSNSLAVMGSFVAQYQNSIKLDTRITVRIMEPFNKTARSLLAHNYNTLDYVRFNDFDFEVTERALSTLKKENIPYTIIGGQDYEPNTSIH